jgi:hypothetical protein
MKTKRTSFLERYFYLFMSLLNTVVVVYAFSYTINQNLLHPRVQPPQIVYPHSVVFSAWVLFFILQSALVRSHNARLHRTLGWLGVGLAVSILVLGYMTSTAVLRLAIQRHLPFPTVSFLIVEMMELVCFAVPFALAIYWRKRPDFHRRLMLIATCALTEAAFGRFPKLPPPLRTRWSGCFDFLRRGSRHNRGAPYPQGLSVCSPRNDLLADHRRVYVHSPIILVDRNRQLSPAMMQRIIGLAGYRPATVAGRSYIHC